MRPEDFLQKACDPTAWRTKAVSLRRSADVVWDEFLRRSQDAINKETDLFDDDKYNEATDILRNSQFLYSLAVECALKGLIIKQQPTEVIFETTVNGTGSLINARFKQKEKNQFDHDLEKLAEMSGMVGNDEHAEIRELLRFSTFCINWFGRYPVPLDTMKSKFIPRGKLPGSAFYHCYRDLMDPFLDRVMATLDS